MVIYIFHQDQRTPSLGTVVVYAFHHSGRQTLNCAERLTRYSILSSRCGEEMEILGRARPRWKRGADQLLGNLNIQNVHVRRSFSEEYESV